MTHKERFHNLFSFQDIDRIPCYFFGSWAETKTRWKKEGFKEITPGETDWYVDAGPQLPGMDPDWEKGMWGIYDLVQTGPVGDIEPCTLWENETRKAIRTSIGEELIICKDGASISHTTKFALEPTRQSWNNFRRFFDTDGRYSENWEQKAAGLNEENRVLPLFGGSLYGLLRNWMGVENISYLMYDDPELLDEMVSHMADHHMRLTEKVLDIVSFDFVYIFEDCCGSSGPLFSPGKYKEIFDKHYKRLIQFYKDKGVPFVLIDSDGLAEALIPCWMGSGFDIFFPVEVGKWGANPADLRKKYGKLRIMGAVDKHLIYGAEEKLRSHLESLRPSVHEGGFLPIPDHRIPPETSFNDMQRYIEIFHEVFNA